MDVKINLINMHIITYIDDHCNDENKRCKYNDGHFCVLFSQGLISNKNGILRCKNCKDSAKYHGVHINGPKTMDIAV